jgi:hypothetical protein
MMTTYTEDDAEKSVREMLPHHPAPWEVEPRAGGHCVIDANGAIVYHFANQDLAESKLQLLEKRLYDLGFIDSLIVACRQTDLSYEICETLRLMTASEALRNALELLMEAGIDAASDFLYDKGVRQLSKWSRYRPT